MTSRLFGNIFTKVGHEKSVCTKKNPKVKKKKQKNKQKNSRTIKTKRTQKESKEP